MKLWKFDNYEEYKEAQIIGYEAKVNTHSRVDTHAIRGLVSYIVDYNSYISKLRDEFHSVVYQLDLIYHSGVDAWKAKIKETKDKYPKNS